MGKESKTTNARRTEKEYLLSIKILIVSQIEQGELTVPEAKQRYGILDKATILNWLVEYASL